MSDKPFCHLHVHTFASTLDGCGNVDVYAEQAKQMGLPALAITEHGNMSSALDHYRACKKAGIKPILGSEFYMLRETDVYSERLAVAIKKRNDVLVEESAEVEDESVDEEESGDEDTEANSGAVKAKDKTKMVKQFDQARYHQIVLVKNEVGWKNACKLNYYSFLKPTDKTYKEERGMFYYKPMIRRPFLFEAKDGLIVTSSCMASEINQYIKEGLLEEAYDLLKLFKTHFKDDFYIEIQLNEVFEPNANQKVLNERLIEFAKTSNTKIILTGDVHYNFAGDAPFQDIMMAVSQGKKLVDEDLFKLSARNLHFQSKDDYYRLNEEFNYGYTTAFIDECLENTLEIAEKVNFEFSKTKHLPKFYDNPEDSKKKFGDLIKAALREYILKHKLTVEKAKTYKERVKYEYDVIVSNGYADYFLLTWDIIRFCKEKDIFIGIGRGSAGSSLISYLLGICGINPMDYDLYFERFMNPEAMSEPDIDMDFEPERREEIIEYLKERWGEENVVRIANFTTFNMKNTLNDLMRVLSKSFDDSKFLTDEKGADIPEDLSPSTVDAWFEAFKDEDDAKSKRIYDWYVDNQDIIQYFKKMYGGTRNLGVHAGGVLITPEPVWNYIPVNRGDRVLVTGFAEAGGSVGKEGKISRAPKKDLTYMGLLKLDILGLSTLGIIKKTIQLVKRRTGKDIYEDVVHLDLNNPELYRVFAKGDNKMVFQFESGGISELVRKAKPKNFLDVATLNSLYRPATLKSGAAMEFALINSGEKPREYIHPLVDKILDITAGVIAFQEQVTRILNACAGIAKGKAEKMRKSIMDREIGKYPELLQEFQDMFVEQCIANGIDKQIAENIKTYLYNNAGYSFNFSHSLSYSYTSLQTLYLKIYYPEEFYSVFFSQVPTAKRKELFGYISDAMKNGIDVQPPNVLHSESDFTPVRDKLIVCGFSMVKRVGKAAQTELIRHRGKYNNLVDFLLHPWTKLNKAAFIPLVKVGAFKEIEPNTKIALELAEYHFKMKPHMDKRDRQKQLKYSREHLENKYAELKASDIKDFTERQMDSHWEEVTGFRYPFRNPFLKYMNAFSQQNIPGISGWRPDRTVVYGEIIQYEERQGKNNKPFYKLKLSDGFSDINVNIWDYQIHHKQKTKMKEGFIVGNIVCIELDHDSKYGHSFKRNGKFGVAN